MMRGKQIPFGDDNKKSKSRAPFEGDNQKSANRCFGDGNALEGDRIMARKVSSWNVRIWTKYIR
jgi:hypothetical protein